MEDPELGCGQVNVRESEICRLCMKSHDYYLNVFVSNEDFKMPIGKAIEDLLVLEVAQGDCLPETVCCPCVTKLMQFREFKEMCMNSARVLGRHAPMEPITCLVKVELADEELVDEGERNKWNEFVEDEGSGHGDDASEALETRVKDGDAGEQREEHAEIGEEDTYPVKKECYDGATVYIESLAHTLRDENHVKEEAERREEMARVKCEREEDINEEDFPVSSVSNLGADPLDVGQMVSGFHRIGEHGNYYRKITNEDINPDFDAKGAPLSHLPTNSTPDSLSQEHLQRNSTFSQASLAEHEKVHTSEKQTYRSQECVSTSSRYSGCQMRHEPHTDCLECRPCNDNVPFQSYSRDEAYKFQSAPANNLKTHSKVKPFACNTCGKGFGRKELLRMHLNSHAGIKPFRCDTCGKAFTNKRHLQSHSLLHDGLKPFKCQQCGMSFNWKTNLLRHELIHVGSKPFQCETCGKSFATKSFLKNHSRVHSGLELHRCHICGKGFLEKKGLQGHVNSHMGARPHQCTTCGKGFARRSDLLNHLVVHSSLKPFKCQTCGNAFKQKRSLNIHVKKMHTGVD